MTVSVAPAPQIHCNREAVVFKPEAGRPKLTSSPRLTIQARAARHGRWQRGGPGERRRRHLHHRQVSWLWRAHQTPPSSHRTRRLRHSRDRRHKSALYSSPPHPTHPPSHPPHHPLPRALIADWWMSHYGVCGGYTDGCVRAQSEMLKLFGLIEAHWVDGGILRHSGVLATTPPTPLTVPLETVPGCCAPPRPPAPPSHSVTSPTEAFFDHEHQRRQSCCSYASFASRLLTRSCAPHTRVLPVLAQTAASTTPTSSTRSSRWRRASSRSSAPSTHATATSTSSRSSASC